MFAVASVALTATLGENRARQASRSAHLESMLDAAAGSLTASSPPNREPSRLQWFHRWACGLAVDDSVLAAALIDPNGAVSSMVPDDVVSAERLLSAVASNEKRLQPAGGMDWAAVHLREIADGSRIVLLSRTPVDWAPAMGSAWPVWSTALGGIVAILLAVWHALDVAAVRPIRSLIHLALHTPRDGESEPMMDRVGGDIGRLAHQVVKLVGETRNSRARLGHLKRTMDARVEYQTRQIQSMLKRAEREAWIDPLTKLGNRRLLDDRLNPLIEEHRRHGEDLSMIAFDVDHFKALNDTLGHAAGDELLRFIGELLRGSLRVSDIGLRLGGDEFAVILLGAGIEEAADTADRLIRLFGQRASVVRSDLKPALSAGVASLKYHKVENGAGLSAAADAGLYRAKRAGKSQVGIVPRTLLAPTLAS